MTIEKCFALAVLLSLASPGRAQEAKAPEGAGEAPSLRVESYSQVCKLLNDRATGDPTANDVEHRFNVAGADLGFSVATPERLWIFFGDTIGYRNYWAKNGPDSVGYVDGTPSEIAAHPRLLCDRLSIVSKMKGRPFRARARRRAVLGPRVAAGFTPAAMLPPRGRKITEFIRNPVDARHPRMPGSFEVPSGAFAADGSIYVFYTGAPGLGAKPPVMGLSYLAKWPRPSPQGPPRYRILYLLDSVSAPRMGGHFINVAPVPDPKGGWLYLFGTGLYRRSAIYLARKRLASLESPGGFEYRQGPGRWSREAGEAVPVAEEDSAGELSARYYSKQKLWMLLYQRIAGGRNEVVARSARRPAGPWSEAVVLHSMEDPAFRSRYCCGGPTCVAQAMIHCDKAGVYSPNLLPDPSPFEKQNGFVIRYLLSTWDPYDTVLMEAELSYGKAAPRPGNSTPERP